MTIEEFILARTLESEARLLAEGRAMRQIVDLASDWSRINEDESNLMFIVLTYLALPYADHPDYDEQWKPSVGCSSREPQVGARRCSIGM